MSIVNGIKIGGGAIGIQLDDNYNFPSGANGLRITLNLSDTKLGTGSVDAARIIAYWSYLPYDPNTQTVASYWSGKWYYSDEIDGDYSSYISSQRKVKIIHESFDFSTDYNKSILLPDPPPPLDRYTLEKAVFVGILTGPQQKFSIERVSPNEFGYYRISIKQQY